MPVASQKWAWTLPAYIEHNEQMLVERDRRYDDLQEERDRALAEQARLREEALRLAREAQHYRDEQSNNLRAQIEQERGSYVTRVESDQNITRLEALVVSSVERIDVTLKPLVEYVAVQQGRRSGFSSTGAIVVGSVATIGAILTIVIIIANALTQ